MAKRRHFFNALGPETEEQIRLVKDKIHFLLTFSFKKVIQKLTFRSHEKLDKFISFQNYWYSWIASSVKTGFH